MLLRDLLDVMENIAPTRYAEQWDNVGLLVGDPQQEIHQALLTIDYTPAVAAESAELECDVVIAYHPPIFAPLKRLTAGDLVFDAIRRGVAIYSPHTALDVAEGGTNDMLADAIGLTQRKPLRPIAPGASHCKLVTFVPEDAVERVSGALFDAGAGRIGHYSHCSFRSPGTGTFLGDQTTNPAVGQAGRLEQAPELRLETLVPVSHVGDVVAALRQAHPYEEPAFDLVKLADPPEDVGQGRIGTMPPVERAEVFERIRHALGVQKLLIAGPTEGPITSAACCAGACGDLLNDALAQKAQLYLTGEMRHHDALRAAGTGMTVVCALHSNSERAVLSRLAERISAALPGLQCRVSRVDRDPFLIA